MTGFKYIVTVCDHSPFANTPLNSISYEYSNERAAVRMMRQAFSMGHCCVMQRVMWSNEEDYV